MFYKLIKKHPLSAFITLTFGISYLIGIPFNIIIFEKVTGNHEIIATYAPIIITLIAPSLSALIITKVRAGNFGIKEKFNTSIITKSNALPFFLTPLFIYILTLGTLILVGIEPIVLLKLSLENWHLFILHLAAHFFIVGIGEEIGWRGWLLPHFFKNKSVGASTLLVFLIWGIWHLPKLAQSTLATTTAFILAFFALSVILTWIWLNYNKNIGLIAMIHASVNAPLFFIGGSTGVEYGITFETLSSAFQIQCIVYFILAILILVFNRKTWWVNSKVVNYREPIKI